MESEAVDAVVVSVGEGNVRAGLSGFDQPNFRWPTARLLAALGSPSTSSATAAAGPAPWSRSWDEWEDAVLAAAVGALETQKRGAGVGWGATREALDEALPLLAGRTLLVARPNEMAMCAPDRVCQLIFEQCGHPCLTCVRACVRLHGELTCGGIRCEAAAYHESWCSVLSLYTSGRTTGLVVDCGYASSTVHFVWDGLVHGAFACAQLDCTLELWRQC
jgi:hypothetical protein